MLLGQVWRESSRDRGVGKEIATTIVAHECRELFHDTHGVLVEVSHHGVGVPPAKELDGVRVNLANEQGHCTAGTK